MLPFEVSIYPTLTRPDRRQDRFMFVVVVDLSSFLLFVGVYNVYHFTNIKTKPQTVKRKKKISA